MRLSDLAHTSNYTKVSFEDPLATVISSLSRGINVLLVVDSSDKLRGVITIMRVLNLISTLSVGSRFVSSSISLFIDERPLSMHHKYPVEAALQLMVEEGKSYIVMVDGLKAVGLLTHRCFLKRLLGAKFKLNFDKIVLRNVTTLLAHNSLAEAYKLMLESGYYEVPVVEDELIGVLRGSDIITEVIGRSMRELRTIKVYGKCKVIERPAKDINEVLEVAFREGLNLIPVSRDGEGVSFVKLEDLFFHMIKELGAFNVAEIIRGHAASKSIIAHGE
ncbi:MAG: CBS domain-containing protein [Candidatus Nezhaarchaeota archaeon]|nr:CBS domain-containing protein [Candidatus Nezhaarchaeota archaeon]MCX8142501.1 CBS domain-containing protein [Candidatus Nezhaarchaeota archaeon]MDW8050526.1 CBS domain-containing protein [Nitrososphaerota archaeon]